MKVIIYLLVFTAALPGNARASLLGSAGNFAVLAGTTVTNTGNTVVMGNLGVSPGTAITGFPPGAVVGTIHDNDAAAVQGESDLLSAYTFLSGLAFNSNLSSQNLGGLTLTSGVYKFDAAAALTGVLTLSGPGTFVFQIGSSFLSANNSSILTAGGANASNVYFEVGSSATVGTGAAMEGNFIALQSISMATGSSLAGRALALNGAVTMQDNAITLSSTTPEPSTFVLFGIAVGAIGLVRVRRVALARTTAVQAK